MNLITDYDLAGRTDVELALLFHMVSQALGHTRPGSPDRDKVIASLQNISRAKALRQAQCRVPGL